MVLLYGLAPVEEESREEAMNQLLTTVIE